MDRLDDKELAAEHRRATLMGNIAANAGEADAEALFASIARACEFEQRNRATGRT